MLSFRSPQMNTVDTGSKFGGLDRLLEMTTENLCSSEESAPLSWGQLQVCFRFTCFQIFSVLWSFCCFCPGTENTETMSCLIQSCLLSWKPPWILLSALGRWPGWSVQQRATPLHRSPGRKMAAQTSLLQGRGGCMSCLRMMCSLLQMWK